MAAKHKPNAPRIVAPPPVESGVQLSARALYERRMAEIEADVDGGRCTVEEGDERSIQALQALYGRVLTREGKAELGELLRELTANHPALRNPKG